MTNSKLLFAELTKKITLDESDGEIHAIVAHLLESVCGPAALRSVGGVTVNDAQVRELGAAVARVNRHEPLQYILNEAWFFGRRFYVDPSVLIPRPETEELVSLVLDRADEPHRRGQIIDVATGSGCIAITLGLELPGATTLGTDISDRALKVARRNASALVSKTKFVSSDILCEQMPAREVAIVVSNPPYIAESERETMSRNVLEHEPELALFVPDADPLVFYRMLADKSATALIPGGMLAVEINARFGNEVAEIFEQKGLQRVELLRDLSGRNRFVTARKAL